MRLSLRPLVLPAVASALLLACSGGVPSESGSSISTASLSLGECEPVQNESSDDVAMSASDAASICNARGLTLDERGGSSDLYKCCKAGPTPIDAGAGSGVCSSQSLGRHDSCADKSTWKDDATKTCELVGGTVSGLHTSDSCGDDLYRYAKFTCCFASPIPDGGVDDDGGSGDSDGGPAGDDDGGFIDGGVGDEDAGDPCQYYAIASINGVCNDSASDLSSAQSTCSGLGLTLEDTSSIQGSCGKGKEAQFNYACCGPTAVTMTSGGPAVHPTANPGAK